MVWRAFLARPASSTPSTARPASSCGSRGGDRERRGHLHRAGPGSAGEPTWSGGKGLGGRLQINGIPREFHIHWENGDLNGSQTPENGWQSRKRLAGRLAAPRRPDRHLHDRNTLVTVPPSAVILISSATTADRSPDLVIRAPGAVATFGADRRFSHCDLHSATLSASPRSDLGPIVPHRDRCGDRHRHTTPVHESSTGRSTRSRSEREIRVRHIERPEIQKSESG